MKIDTRSIMEHLVTRNLHNKKPYRTPAQKAEAKRNARLVDGRWVSTAAVSLHRQEKGLK